jgi:hypothetical protein
MDTYGLARDPVRRARWEELVAELERLRDAFGNESNGVLGMTFGAVHGILAIVCKIAHLHGQGVTAVMTFAPPSDEHGTDGRLAITVIGGRV